MLSLEENQPKYLGVDVKSGTDLRADTDKYGLHIRVRLSFI
jgi:hypothetical protein